MGAKAALLGLRHRPLVFDMAGPLIRIKDLRRQFTAGDENFLALKDLSLSIDTGEMVAIIGASG